MNIALRWVGTAVARTQLLGTACVLAMLLVLVTACNSGSGSGPARLPVVTTFYPLQYLAQRIGGDWVQVANLVPPGAEPHDWEPTPKDVVSIQRAKVFIYHGSGFETWVERVVRDLPKNGPSVVNATQDFDLHPGISEEEESGEAAAGTPVFDPHVWLDPQRYGRQGELVEAALAKADPARAATYAANLAGLKRDLTALESEFRQGLSACARDTIVTSHAAFAYMADRFGLKQLPISGVSPESEPSPARLREIVQDVRRHGATVIFFETLVSPAVSETIARETGATALVLDPIEGLTQEETSSGQDYFTLMREDLKNLRTALGCR